jgi:dienelactone hydrolase
VKPAGEVRGTALVLPGSSNRLETARAELLAAQGIAALPMRLFEDSLELVELDRYIEALDLLATLSPALGVVGTSKGAEAALLIASRDPRVTGVVAFAPSHVVWAGLGGRPVSSWTWHGQPLPFVRFDETWQPDGDPPAYRGLYEASLPAAPADAHIPVEQISSEVLLAAGGADKVWPSVPMAQAIRQRRDARKTTVHTHAAAGHRIVLPGETPAGGGQRMVRGGTPDAAAALGDAVWSDLVRVLTAPSGPD